MARETRGVVPERTGHLRRASLTGSHWHQVRWWLAGQAVVAAASGAVSLAVVLIAGSRRHDPVIADVRVSAGLAWCLLSVAALCTVALVARRVALVVTATLSIAGVVLVIVVAVAGAHHAHPFGSTLPVLLLWAVVFCVNFACTIWLVPDHLEGPDWVRRRRGGQQAHDDQSPQDSR